MNLFFAYALVKATLDVTVSVLTPLCVILMPGVLYHLFSECVSVIADYANIKSLIYVNIFFFVVIVLSLCVIMIPVMIP